MACRTSGLRQCNAPWISPGTPSTRSHHKETIGPLHLMFAGSRYETSLAGTITRTVPHQKQRHFFGAAPLQPHPKRGFWLTPERHIATSRSRAPVGTLQLLGLLGAAPDAKRRDQVFVEFHPHRVAGVHSWAGTPRELALLDSSEGGREAVVVPLEPR